MTAEPPEVPERGQQSEGRPARAGGVQIRHVALVAGVIAAVAVGGYLWLAGDDSPGAGETADARKPVVAEEGVACAYLQEAFTHRQAGNTSALRRSVDEAAQASEQALQQSGQEFGIPEKIAIELKHALIQPSDTTAGDVARYFDKAREACEEMGQWASKR